MNLRQYVEKKYGLNKCLTKIEARALGIQFPLRHGWLDLHGDLPIEGATLDKLTAALINCPRKSAGNGMTALGLTPTDLQAFNARAAESRLELQAWHAEQSGPFKKQLKAERRKEAARRRTEKKAAALTAKLARPQPTHVTVKKRGLTYEQANADEFLSSFAWRQLRWRVIQHYGARCMCCGTTPEHGAVMNVDHIKSRRKRPDLALEFDNLQVLCHDCNHGKGNDEADYRPAPVDPEVLAFLRSL